MGRKIKIIKDIKKDSNKRFIQRIFLETTE